MSETFPANSSLSDVLVAIHSRTEIGFGIVQMERQNLVQANQSGDFLDRAVPTFLGPDIITAREKMSGIKANPDRSGCLT